MNAVDLQPTLRGERVHLRPLAPGDFQALYAAASDPRIWEQHPEPTRYQEPVFRRYFDGGIACGGALLILDAATGQAIGSSRYHGYDSLTREVEIGWTFLARAYWGGLWNREVKRLMLRHAFGFADRVVFYIGAGNRRSQIAIERIGAVRAPDGVGPARDGHLRFEITAPQYVDRS
jgi:RimJ/RimL family protein N-acetyltransferase